ncbi:hypothetical protein [Nitrosovibrio sp. Nv17]|uniref:hypothetical protein n=1 Tax=Nitrosovibrio sp. Nv17 TaxID=1855339 RepID=UPI000908710F|nr:hypothetical protein [Nitrosovibrio sp. Nv17]SFW34140.1 hypothetical protein SAMN05216414_12041 [Nitrosovibrio sp. Nv17]
MTDDRQTPPQIGYDEILERLDALLRSHRHGSCPTPDPAASAVPADVPPPAEDGVPILSEQLSPAPATLSPQADITALLEEIVDAALGDANADLDAGSRQALVHALESHLFGL